MHNKLLSVVVAGGALLASVTAAHAAQGVWASTGHEAGSVNVGWSSRGGSCHVRYTESGAGSYHYETVTNCDSAHVTIGSLQPGAQYRFSVMSEGSVWSAPVYARAARGAYMAQNPAAPAAQMGHQETVAEGLPADDYPTHYTLTCGHQGSMWSEGMLNNDERATGKCGVGVTNVRTVAGPHSGEVTVYWSDNSVSDGQYHVMYGTESGHYTMGALNVGGESDSYTVRGLTPGQRYYFKLVPVSDGHAVGSTWEVSDVAW